MNANEKFSRLAGICWHEQQYHCLGGSTLLCAKCKKYIGGPGFNPDYEHDPLAVLRVMRAREDWPKFLKMIGSNKCHVPVEYKEIPKGQWLDEMVVYGMEVVRIDLLLDNTGRLRDAAIEWLEKGENV